MVSKSRERAVAFAYELGRLFAWKNVAESDHRVLKNESQNIESILMGCTHLMVEQAWDEE